MPVGDEYSAGGGGGKLKLKGSKVSDGRIEKKKAKKAKKKEQAASAGGENNEATSSNEDGRRGEVEKGRRRSGDGDGDGEDSTPTGEDSARIEESRRDDKSLVVGKTETERQYEEKRRKRLFERIQRDGVKTHKERVEELNKYLSGLTEHHDMPKIGPG